MENIRPDLTEELYAKRILGEGLTILSKHELFNPTFRVGNSWERWSEIARELTDADIRAG
jgi:hypothetical protein